MKGIHALLSGNHWFPRELMNRWIEQSAGLRGSKVNADNILGPITPREKEILMLIVQGASNAEISGQFHISYHTVKTHLSNIYKKINVSNRLQASLWSLRNL